MRRILQREEKFFQVFLIRRLHYSYIINLFQNQAGEGASSRFLPFFGVTDENALEI